MWPLPSRGCGSFAAAPLQHGSLVMLHVAWPSSKFSTCYVNHNYLSAGYVDHVHISVVVLQTSTIIISPCTVPALAARVLGLYARPNIGGGAIAESWPGGILLVVTTLGIQKSPTTPLYAAPP